MTAGGSASSTITFTIPAGRPRRDCTPSGSFTAPPPTASLVAIDRLEGNLRRGGLPRGSYFGCARAVKESFWRSRLFLCGARGRVPHVGVQPPHHLPQRVPDRLPRPVGMGLGR